MADKKYVLDPVWASRLPKMWRWMRNLRVTGGADFKNTEDGASIGIPTQAASSAAEPAKLPVGEYQFQVFQMTAQNESGWDFDHIHPQIV